MDALETGRFIAQRRKELGLTQKALAQQLHVTDKAVSKWERGAGLPDINTIEPLAAALEVSVLSLMQGRQEEPETLRRADAEQLVLEAIRLPRPTPLGWQVVGGGILAVFAVIIVLLLGLAIQEPIVIYSVMSISLGLVAWGIPIAQMAFGTKRTLCPACFAGMTAAALSLLGQFLDIAREVYTDDFAALLDIMDAIVLVVVLFLGVTCFLHICMLIHGRKWG